MAASTPERTPYYLVFGQNNEEEDDSKEVIRVVKYNKSWGRLAAASLRGANTIHPFDYGNLRMDEKDGYLYVLTCHEMYTNPSDGLNHQANMLLQIRTSDMAIVDPHYRVAADYGYVSHSFNQFILIDDQGCMVQLDHGDAYPRSAVLCRYRDQAGAESINGSITRVHVFPFYGKVGDHLYQYTKASLGGLEYSSTNYLVAGNSVVQDGSGRQTRNIFVTATSRSDFSESGTTFRWITSYQEGSASASTPQLVKMGANSFLLLWMREEGKLHYMFLDGAGKPVGTEYTKNGYLSDCKPTVQNGKAIWFVSDGFGTTFYTVSADGSLTTQLKDYAGTDMPSGDFGENNALHWSVDLDGILTISGNGAMPDDEYPWRKYNDNITTLVIQDGITAIGSHSFSNLSALKSVTIPKSVTSIGSYAFLYCDSLTSVVIPASVTDISYYAFWYCGSLTSVTVLRADCRISGLAYFYGQPTYALGDPEKVTIHGYDGSTALNYARNYGYNFAYIPFNTVPTGIAVSSTAEGVVITWSGVSGASKYRVLYKTGAGDWTAAGDTVNTSYTWTGAKSGTAYSFTVQRVSADGSVVTSDYDPTGVTFTYVAPTPEPTATPDPTPEPTADPTPEPTADPTPEPTADPTPEPTADPTPEPTATPTPAPTKLSTPKISKAENKPTGVKITWGAVSDAAKYRVYYKLGSGAWTKIADTSKTNYTWTKAQSGTKYAFSVVAFSQDGSVKSAKSANCNKTYIGQVKISKAENKPTGVKLTWGKVGGAAAYRVFYKTGSGDWTKIADTTATSYT